MKINIGIPVYNGGATLGRVLEAIIGQFPQRDKIIVVDDGSRDRSAAVAGMRAVRVISHVTNKGLAEARNTIIKHSDCDILIFFDADAAPRPGCIDALTKPFNDPSVVAVGGRGEEADCSTRAAKWRSRTTPQSHGECSIADDWMIMGLCAAFRKSALIDVGGFDTRFDRAGEDVDVSLRLRHGGGKLVYLPDAIVDHLPSGDLYAVTRQAYTHSKYASYALSKNDMSARDYFVDSARCLTYSTVNDLKKGRLSDCGIGAINFAARAAGIAAGTLMAKRDRQKNS